LSTITKPVDESRINTIDQEFESSTGTIENDYFDKRVEIKEFEADLRFKAWRLHGRQRSIRSSVPA
jgi:hypothetical protein